MDEKFEQVVLEEAAEAVEEVPSEPEVTTEPEEADGLAAVRRELEALRGLLEAQVHKAGEPTVTDAFRALYPDVEEEDIPDEVWQSAQEGLPLEAAYALYERRALLRQAAAEQVNRKNAGVSWGKTDGAGDGFLSPDEVRQMTQEEVRLHYDRILASMKHWN